MGILSKVIFFSKCVLTKQSKPGITHRARDLVDIFEKLCLEHQFNPAPEALEKMAKYLADIGDEEIDALGNARLVRNIFEKTIATQSIRVIRNNLVDDGLILILGEDMTFPKEAQKTKIGFN